MYRPYNNNIFERKRRVSIKYDALKLLLLLLFRKDQSVLLLLYNIILGKHYCKYHEPE